jgi:cell division protein FtsB
MWRVGICSLVLGLGSAAVVHGFQPYAMRHQQKRETAQLVQSLNDALEQNRTLKRQIESLRVGQGLEIAARKLGYVRKGEIPLQISIASTAK